MIRPRVSMELLKKEDDKKFQCGKCGQIAENPVQCEYDDCKKFFCKLCLDQQKQSKDMCPTCNNEPSKAVKPNIFIQNEIDILEVKCQNKECKEILILSQLQYHQKQCKYNKVKCPNKNCDVEVFVMDMENHKNKCTGEQSICKKCDKEKGEDHDCLKNLLEIVNDFNEEIRDLGSELINTQIILQNLCKRFNELKFKEAYKQKINIPKCKMEHVLQWIGYDQFECALCGNYKNIRYYCEQCNEGYCQDCQIPVFRGNQCPIQHIMIYDNKPNSTISCDFCGKKPYENGDGAFSDRYCNFDICKTCFDKMSS